MADDDFSSQRDTHQASITVILMVLLAAAICLVMFG